MLSSPRLLHAAGSCAEAGREVAATVTWHLQNEELPKPARAPEPKARLHSAKANVVPFYLCRTVTPSGREGKPQKGILWWYLPTLQGTLQFSLGFAGNVAPKGFMIFLAKLF